MKIKVTRIYELKDSSLTVELQDITLAQLNLIMKEAEEGVLIKEEREIVK